MMAQTIAQAIRGVGGPYRIGRTSRWGNYRLLDSRARIAQVAGGPLLFLAQVLSERQTP